MTSPLTIRPWRWRCELTVFDVPNKIADRKGVTVDAAIIASKTADDVSTDITAVEAEI